MTLLLRNVSNSIINDLDDKIVLISGPRQTGKTTLSKNLGLSYDYLKYDVISTYQELIDKR